jgi:hypothetical protein
MPIVEINSYNNVYHAMSYFVPLIISFITIKVPGEVLL